jgi:NADH-quinone oxidoreductase subunit E
VTEPTAGATVAAVEVHELSVPPLTAEARARIERARGRYPQPKSAILPALWAVQDQYGWLPPSGMAEVAELLGLRPSEVQAVSTFYSMYFQRPAGRHHLLVCVNTSCALRGADELCAYLEDKLGVPSKGTTEDGEFTWEATIECLGACGYAPMMQIDHLFYEHLTSAERIDAALDRARHTTGHGDGHAAASPDAGAKLAGASAEPADQPVSAPQKPSGATEQPDAGAPGRRRGRPRP